MSAVLEETKSAKLSAAHPRPKAPPAPVPAPCPINVELLQAHVDSIVRDMDLPVVNTQLQPLENYVDDSGKTRRRLRKACQLDESGNVIFGTGPVVTDDYTIELWEKIRHLVEQDVTRTAYRMSEELLIPERNGTISDRAKVIHIFQGRLVPTDVQ